VCAETPETLRLYSTDPDGEDFLEERQENELEIYKVKVLRPVLCVDVVDCIAECAMEKLEDVVEAERESRGWATLCADR